MIHVAVTYRLINDITKTRLHKQRTSSQKIRQLQTINAVDWQKPGFYRFPGIVFISVSITSDSILSEWLFYTKSQQMSYMPLLSFLPHLELQSEYLLLDLLIQIPHLFE